MELIQNDVKWRPSWIIRHFEYLIAIFSFGTNLQSIPYPKIHKYENFQNFSIKTTYPKFINTFIRFRSCLLVYNASRRRSQLPSRSMRKKSQHLIKSKSVTDKLTTNTMAFVSSLLMGAAPAFLDPQYNTGNRQIIAFDKNTFHRPIYHFYPLHNNVTSIYNCV